VTKILQVQLEAQPDKSEARAMQMAIAAVEAR
jgi:hypothetical protein